MNTTLKTIEIDIYSPTSYEVIKAQQGDHNARSIELILFDQGKPYEITDNITLQFTGYRGNGSAFFKNNCVFAEGNRIIITLTNDILYYAGTIEAKIVLYDTPNRSVLSTVPFQIVCEKTPCHEGCLTQNENTIITDLIFQVEEFSESAAETIRQSEENADNAANSAASAADSAKEALDSKNAAESSKFAAAESETNAAASADTASVKAAESADSAKTARSYACGDTNLRPDESADNAKYYYMQSKEIYDDFTQSGSVVGVKGNAQTEYQSGFVNLTAEQIGALPNTMKATISNSYNRANAAYGQANMAYNRANAAYDQANLSYNIINSDSLCLGNNASYPGYCTTAVGGNAIACGNHATALGYDATANGYAATALGFSAKAEIYGSTAVGYNTNSSHEYCTSFGYSATAECNRATALGVDTHAGYCATAIGDASKALGFQSVAIGGGVTPYPNTIAIGYNAVTLNTGANVTDSEDSILIGHNVSCKSAPHSVIIGAESRTTNYDSIAIGYNSYASQNSAVTIGSNSHSNGGGVALGSNATASAYGSIALGSATNAYASEAIAIGTWTTSSSGVRSIAIGSNATAAKMYSASFGTYANAQSNYSTALGHNATVSAVSPNTIQLGGSTVSKICGYVSFSTNSDERDKADITDIKDSAVDFLNKIHAIRYFRNQRELYIDEENLSEEEKARKAKFGLCAYDREAHAKGTKKGSRARVGVRAQEVLKALEETYGDSGYGNLVDDNFFDLNPEDIPEGVENQLTVNYTGFIPFLIKAVQELSQQINEKSAVIEDLSAKISLSETLQTKTESPASEETIINE